MEINKLCKRLDNLPNNIRMGYIKDITEMLDTMFEEYDIFYKDTSEPVKKQLLIKKFKLNEQEQEITTCKGFSQNGNKCFKRTHQDSDFCKVHAYLAFRNKSQVVSCHDDIDIQQIQIKNSTTDLDVLSLKEKFIDDSFYYYDNRFVYDKTSLERVGYIDENKNCILSDDPFILEIL